MRSFFFFVFVIACWINPAIAGEEPVGDTAANPLFVDPATTNFSQNEDLLDRVLASPHGYFRFINIPFSQLVCKIVDERMINMPSMNLHGDAHLEQYAITDIGRGLTDFDDASTGPGVIDIMRMGVSIHLAARESGWPEYADSLSNLFLKGYADALDNPEMEASEPSVVERIRAGFTVNRSKYFEWVASVMQPMEASVTDSLIAALVPYIETKIAERPDRDPVYFKVTDCGYLQMGIGSALDMKFLVRIEGESGDPHDDVVLECKEVRDLSGIECIDPGREKDPFRILVGQTRIAYNPFRHLGYFRFRNRNFWVHSWVDNYKEIKIGKSFANPGEMAEVVYDIGVQLGRGHVKHIAYPLDLQLRREQAALLREHKDEAMKGFAKLADQTVAAWERFCEACKS
ncbi:MAG: DUF2252 family protein [Calditrichaeota bacterium]|nr:DUF2252 family protein [Calditrichota bacterium]